MKRQANKEQIKQTVKDVAHLTFLISATLTLAVCFVMAILG